nr:cuticle protein 7-like [Lepeophtheirus salmonis]
MGFSALLFSSVATCTCSTTPSFNSTYPSLWTIPTPPPPPPPPPPPAPAYSPYGPPSPPPPSPPPPANYAYSYSVLDAESGVDISADEQADNGAVSGSYKVALPDGRIKAVTYTVVGDSGFVADVQYEAAPVSVAPVQAPAPAPYPTYVPYSF